MYVSEEFLPLWQDGPDQPTTHPPEHTPVVSSQPESALQ